MKKLLTLVFLGLLISACEKEQDSDSCVNQDQINQNVLCTADYTPVCGCDGVTYSNICAAKNYGGVTSYTQGICGCTYKHSGKVVDYTGLDGCGLMVELSNGTVLEPIGVPANYTLVAGTYVELDYRVFTTYVSDCMAGELADIICIRNKSCEPFKPVTFHQPANFIDEVNINDAELNGNCLNINFSHGGGCGEHDFELRLLPVFCPTPPMPPVLQLVHNANGDLCQAYLTKDRGYDISALQEPGVNSVDFILTDNTGKYNKQFTYKY